MNQDVRPLRICRGFFINIKNMEQQKYTYTFTFESSGFMVESEFKILKGQKFEYWGYTWIVEGEYSEFDFYCKMV